MNRNRRGKVALATGQVAKFPVKKFRKFLSFLKINSRDYGRIDFLPNLLGSQKYALEQLIDGLSKGITTFVFLKCRGCGITTIFIAVDFFYAMRNPGLLGTFILHEEKALEKWRAIVDLFISSMPSFVDRDDGSRARFRPGIKKHNRSLLWLSNDSMYTYLTAGVEDNRDGGLGRSQHTNYVHSSETAFYGSDEQLKEFRSSVSHLYANRLQIYESTANGFNHFYHQVQDAKSSETVRFIFIGWWRDERNQFHVKDKRFSIFCPDKKLTVLERGRVRSVKEAYGYDISLQQMAWYRWKLDDEFNGNQSLMDQEFPWTEDNAFQATGSKWLEASVLTRLFREAHKYGYNGYKYHMTRQWEDIGVATASSPQTSDLKIWEHASKFGYYIISCDPAWGSSDEADNFCIQAWRAFSDGIDQVAEFCSPTLSWYQCAWIIAHLAGFYGKKDCRVIIEINGGGKAVFRELTELQKDLRMLPPHQSTDEIKHCLDHMHNYMYNRIDTLSSEYAWQLIMTEDIKRMIMAGFKDAVELGKMRIKSVPLVAEMQGLVNNEGSVAADGAGNDDRAVTAAMAWECYRKWLRPKLLALGHTRQKAHEVDEKGGDQTIDRLLINHLRRSNIKVGA